MYRAFYGLREKPFNLTPDPRFLYLSEKHKEAFAHLLYGIRSRTGFVMVTGEIGTGKTTICRNLLNQLDEDTELAFIFNPMLSPLELLKKIASEFGVDSKGANTLELTEELNQYLLEAAAKGKNCVLLIDEAQNLDPQVLEQIRLLSNLETETDKLLQIVLIGQPELGEKLALHELRQLNQRITARYHLHPLSEKEVMQYIAYRLHVAGGRRKVKFSKGAIRAVYKISGGTPRVINALCDRALLIGFTKEVHTITAAIVSRAHREIRGDDIFGKGAPRRTWRQWLLNPIAAATAVLLLAIVYTNSPVLRQRTTGYLDSLASRLPEADPVVLKERPVAPVQKSTAPVATPAPGESAGTPTARPESTPIEKDVDTAATAPVDPSLSETEDAPPLPPSLFEQDEADAARAAVRTVLSKWDKPVEGELPDSLDEESLTAYAAANGLAIEYLSPAIDQLLALDLPAIVQLQRDGTARAATVTAVDADTLTVESAGDTWNMTRDAFREHYTGEAVILWEDPTPGAPALMPGSRNTRVRDLRDALARLGRIPATGNQDTYDGAVSKAVARLQAETSLDVDGIAGKQVRMVLQSWKKPAGTPGLGTRLAQMEPAASRTPAPPAQIAETPAETKTSPASGPAEDGPRASSEATANAQESTDAGERIANESPAVDKQTAPETAKTEGDQPARTEVAAEAAGEDAAPSAEDTDTPRDVVTISNVTGQPPKADGGPETARESGEGEREAAGTANAPAALSGPPAARTPNDQLTVVELPDPGTARDSGPADDNEENDSSG